jgi:hypothetical protein
MSFQFSSRIWTRALFFIFHVLSELVNDTP